MASFGAVKDFVKDTLVSDTLAAVVGNALFESILDIQEDIINIEDEDKGDKGKEGISF